MGTFWTEPAGGLTYLTQSTIIYAPVIVKCQNSERKCRNYKLEVPTNSPSERLSWEWLLVIWKKSQHINKHQMILQQHLAQFISPRKMFVSLSVWGTHMSHNHPEVYIIFQPPALHPSPHRGNLKQSLLQRHSPSVTWSCMKVVFHTSLHLYDIGYSKAPSAKLKPAQSQSGGGHRWAAKCDILKVDFQHKSSVQWTTKRME